MRPSNLWGIYPHPWIHKIEVGCACGLLFDRPVRGYMCWLWDLWSRYRWNRYNRNQWLIWSWHIFVKFIRDNIMTSFELRLCRFLYHQRTRYVWVYGRQYRCSIPLTVSDFYLAPLLFLNIIAVFCDFKFRCFLVRSRASLGIYPQICGSFGFCPKFCEITIPNF